MNVLQPALTVDDDPIVRADLRLVLEDAGYSVCDDARDGVEAVELARTQRPDVIVLDLALPAPGRRRGDAAGSSEERDVPIVALTGYASEAGGIAAQALEAGAVSVVRKPFSETAVVGAVRDALAAQLEAARESLPARRSPRFSARWATPEDWADGAGGAPVRVGQALEARAVVAAPRRPAATSRRRSRSGAATTVSGLDGRPGCGIDVEAARRDVVRRVRDGRARPAAGSGRGRRRARTDRRRRRRSRARRSGRRRRRAARRSRSATASR